MTRLGCAVLAICLSVASASEAAPGSSHGCAGLRYTCAELVQFGFTYPFLREAGSYLFVNGVAYPYAEMTGRLLDDSAVRMPDSTTMRVRDLLAAYGLATEGGKELVPVLGYGSNASPDQLVRKFVATDFPGSAVIPVMKGRLKDYDIAWSPLFVAYGAMPATIIPSPGTEVEVWVTWLNRAAVERMDASEGSGGLYASGILRDAQLELDGPRPREVRVYVSCYGALRVNGAILALAAVPATGRTSRPVDAATAIRAVFPALHWQGSVFDLLLENVTSEPVRNDHTKKIQGLGVKLPDPNFASEHPCGASPGAGGGAF